MRLKNIPLRARNLIRRHGTTDPYRIARELGFDVMLLPLPNGVNGMWRRILRRKYIVINDALNEWQQTAVLCHELGHYLMHQGYATYAMAGRTFFSNTRYENEANLFAAAMMHTIGSDHDEDTILRFLTASR